MAPRMEVCIGTASLLWLKAAKDLPEWAARPAGRLLERFPHSRRRQQSAAAYWGMPPAAPAVQDDPAERVPASVDQSWESLEDPDALLRPGPSPKVRTLAGGCAFLAAAERRIRQCRWTCTLASGFAAQSVGVQWICQEHGGSASMHAGHWGGQL